jgi:hypothetical protein
MIYWLFSGHNLKVVNMNQQSDSSDLLGGWVTEIIYII